MIATLLLAAAVSTPCAAYSLDGVQVTSFGWVYDATDFDGDGRADLHTSSEIILATGQRVPVIFGDGKVGDVNGDGLPDVVSIQPAFSAIVTSLNLGRVVNGFMFTQVNTPYAFDQPEEATLADINEDGRADLIVTSRYSSASAEFFGQADGRFRAGGGFSTLVGGLSGDFNHDHHRDLIWPGGWASFSAYDRIRFFAGDGHGIFRDTQVPINDDVDSVLASGDFNGDGADDLVVRTSARRLGIAFAGSAGFKVVTIGGNQWPTDARAADLNGDGAADLVVVEASLGVEPVIATYINDGAGGMTRRWSYPMGRHPVLADLDADGIADLLASTFGVPERTVAVRGRGDGTFVTPRALGTPNPRLVADFDGDGSDDFLTIDPSGTASVYWNDGNAVFSPGPLSRNLSSFRLVAADTDGDGAAELVESSQRSRLGELAIWKVGRDGALREATRVFSTGWGADDVAPGTFRDDGRRELAVVSKGPSFDRLELFDLASPGFPRVFRILHTNSYFYAMAVGDVNGDGRDDIVLVGHDRTVPTYGYPLEGYVSLLLSNGSDLSNEQRIYQSDGALGRPAVADVDGDGVADIVVFDQTASKPVILHAEQRPRARAFSAFDGWHPVTMDVNGDGRSDLLFSSGTDFLEIWLGSPRGASRHQVLLAGSQSFVLRSKNRPLPSILMAGDIPVLLQPSCGHARAVR